jgi:hypothetical protein
VAVPLSLSGQVAFPDGVLNITHDRFISGGRGVVAKGGTESGSAGVFGAGGFSTSSENGGNGVFGMGGSSNSAHGGAGVRAEGGGSDSGSGGWGVLSQGGSGGGPGGSGVEAKGGNGHGGGFGGNGVFATGGDPDGKGVVATGGIGPGGTGVEATGGDGTGPTSTAGAGLRTAGGANSGPNSASGPGIVAMPGAATDGAFQAAAGLFLGRVVVSGDLNVGGDLTVTGTKNFKIDHPLDPENRYLFHAAIESSEVLNIYSGTIVTDANGEVVVTLPEWFEALNRDLRYQLTVIGTFAQAIVAEKVKHNRFTIRTNAPNVEVSWQVTGVRSDAVMLKHLFKAEEDKPERERGTYLNPEAFDQPEERGAAWVRYPEVMHQLKQQLARGRADAKAVETNRSAAP